LFPSVLILTITLYYCGLIIKKSYFNGVNPNQSGMAATVFFLSYGIYGMRKGDSVLQQKMMRGRVLAQGFTIITLVVGSLLMSSLGRKHSKEE
jgi:hypothetical protein